MTVGAHCATTISKYVEIWASECVLLKNTSHLQLYREDRIFLERILDWENDFH